MKVDTFRARDGCRLRAGTWRTGAEPRRGAVLLLHGRTEYLEKYAETAADLNRRGFDVHSLDWRGQGLSDRPLPDSKKGHVGSYDEYLQDLSRWVERLRAGGENAPAGILAHSMGGHIALRYLREFSPRVGWVLLVSPMLDICRNPFTCIALRAAVQAAAALGGKNAYAWGGRQWRPERGFGDNRLTSDRARFDRERKRQDRLPALALGGVTFGWLQATFRSIEILRGTGYPEAISARVGIVGAGKERVVSLAAQRRMARRLAAGRFYLIPGARHEILQETDAIRRRFWHIFDRFTA